MVIKYVRVLEYLVKEQKIGAEGTKKGGLQNFVKKCQKVQGSTTIPAAVEGSTAKIF